MITHVDDPLAFPPATPLLERRRRVGVTKEGLGSTKYRTFGYWWQLRCLLKTFPQHHKGMQAAAVLTDLEKIAKGLDDLPTLGVDPVAVECARNTAKIFRTLATRAREPSTPTYVVQNSIPGMAADAFGVASRDVTKDMSVEFRRARQRLTQSYNLEFASME